MAIPLRIGIYQAMAIPLKIGNLSTGKSPYIQVPHPLIELIPRGIAICETKRAP
jgi:hypothetical protein